MTAAGSTRRRSMHLVLVWLWLLLGVGNLGRAAYHLGARDELWGLGLAVQGGIGLTALALSYYYWRGLRRDRLGQMNAQEDR